MFNWFRRRKKAKPSELRPLRGLVPTTPKPKRLLDFARTEVSITTGFGMMMADAANHTLRHCRIGMVYPRDNSAD